MFRRYLHIGFLGAAFLVVTACPSRAATYDWGTTGVSDTTVVTNIEQLTTNVLNDGIVSGDYPTSSGFAPNPWNGAADWIAYTANTNTSSSADKEIFVSRPDGTGKTQLTANSVEDSNASFGTDGKIYFERDIGSYQYNIYRMESNGTNPVNLTAAHSGTQSEHNVALSPDGSKIAYHTRNLSGNNDLWVANADGTSPQQVSDPGYQLSDYQGNHSWSPDSSRLAYNCYNTTNWTYQICVVNADGTVPDDLTKDDPVIGTGDKSWPTWSPDGSKIAFLYKASPSFKVMIINPDGSGLVAVDEYERASVGPSWSYPYGPVSWSPDSNWLAYIKEWYDGVSTYTYTLNMVNVNTKAKHQLTQGYYDYAPFWSPTGSQILFSDSRYYASRDDSDLLGAGTNNGGDLLLINLIGDYGPPEPPPPVKHFPWPMYLPAIEKAGKKK